MESNKFVFESVLDFLQPKGINDILNLIKNLSVSEKIQKLRQMKDKWGFMYKELINNEQIKNNFKQSIKEELDKLDVLSKVNYIEKLEQNLSDIFNNFRDEKTLKDLKQFIINQPFEEKTELIYRFFKSWPDLFKDIEDDQSIDEETNKILLLYKIKAASDKGEISQIEKFIKEIGKKYGRKNIFDLAQNIKIPGDHYNRQLFNTKDLQQLKISLYKETRDQEEIERDEHFNIYAFISYTYYEEVDVDGETLNKKKFGIENLVKIDKYNISSLSQIEMMRLRQRTQYGNNDKESGLWFVYIPKYMWDKDYAHNEEIPDIVRKYVYENKNKI